MLKVKQIKSGVKTNTRQVETLKGLGLKRIGHEVTVPNTKSSRGMITKVSHLVSWTESSK